MDPLALHQSFLTDDLKQDGVMLFVESTNWYQSLSSKDTKYSKSFLTKVNSKLNEPSSRLEGLLLLSTVLSQASTSRFTENYQSWIQVLKKIIFHEPDVRYRCLATQILGEILKIGSKFPEHKRYLASIFIPSYIKPFLELDETYDLVVAYGLLSILRYYPGPCHQHFVIQKRIIEMLCVKDPTIVEVSSSCLALLPLIYSRFGRENARITSWEDLYNKCCMSLQLEFNVLYENCEIECSEIKLEDTLLFPSTLKSLDPTLVYIECYHRAVSIFSCIRKLLGTDIQKTVPIEATINLVKRVMKITSNSLSKSRNSEVTAPVLYSVLPRFHQEALRLLESLILSCRQHVLLHNQTVVNLILSTLQWTSTLQGELGNENSLWQLRNAAYEVFLTWSSVMGSSSDISNFSEALVKQHLKDVMIIEKTSGYKIAIPSDCNPKAKRQRLGESLLKTNQSDPLLHLNGSTCILALKSLRVIVQTVCEDLASTTTKEVTSFVLSTLLKLQCVSCNEVPPYHDVQCRSGLFKLLTAMVLVPSLTTQALLSHSAYIFSRGQQDSSPKVSKICFQGLAICRAIMNPIRRCLGSDLPVQETTQKLDADNESEVEMEVPDYFITSMSQANNQAIENSHTADVTHITNDISPKKFVDNELSDNTRSYLSEKSLTQDGSKNLNGDLRDSIAELETQTIHKSLDSSQLGSVALPEVPVVESAGDNCTTDEVSTIDNSNDEENLEGDLTSPRKSLNKKNNKSDIKSKARQRTKISNSNGITKEKKQQKKPLKDSVEAMLKSFVTGPPDAN